jgi:glutamate/aspartate transport system substrate-binding protein
MLRPFLLVCAALFASSAVHAQSLDGRLKRIVETRSIAIAYRADATPFSFMDDKNQVTGFSIDLCKRVVNSIERQHNVQGIAIKWVPVTTQTRFDAVAKGDADMECGSSTVTLSRLKQVDFSSFIFVETTGLLVKTASGLRSISDMSGKRIAVVGGTTNERAIQEQIKRRQLNAAVVPFTGRDDALAALEDDKADAFASDKLLLVGSTLKAKNAAALTLIGEDLSFEPYGIVLPRGDAALRLAVDTGLSQLYRSSEIEEIFGRWFAAFGRPSPIIEAIYLLGAIPE